MDVSFHDQVKRQILQVCNALGLQAKEEYRGYGWRADVLVIANDKKFAFEVQITQQTLLRTLERQEKYNKENMIGCWLFRLERSGADGGGDRCGEEPQAAPVLTGKSCLN